MPRTELAICEIFNPVIHGSNNNNSYGISGHFLVHNTISIEDWYNYSFQDIITLLRDAYDNYLSAWGNRLPQHPIVLNYEAIIRGCKYIKLDIVVLDELEGRECVGYIKTHWLRLVQRRWKKIYRERQEIIKLRAQPKSIARREQTGKWPKQSKIMPKFQLGLVN
jgi:hypothetical protein